MVATGNEQLTGRRFGRLVVQAVSLAKYSLAHCVCDCGQSATVLCQNLRNGGTQSCGCLQMELVSVRSSRHRHTAKMNGRTSKCYMAWRSMKKRCHSPRSKNYRLYGGRGISVCDQWRDSFERFLADMGEPPSPAHSLDRIDNDGNYEPSNCRWATAKQQGRNTRANRLITVNGETFPLVVWSERTGVKYTTIYQRLARGWPQAQAIGLVAGGNRR